MPVLVPAMPVAPVPAIPASAAETAPTAESGGEFQASLSTALTQGQTGGGENEHAVTGDTGGTESSLLADPAIAGGNVLPPVLPLILPPEANAQVPAPIAEVATDTLRELALAAAALIPVSSAPAAVDGDAPTATASGATTQDAPVVSSSLPKPVMPSVATVPNLFEARQDIPLSGPVSSLPVETAVLPAIATIEDMKSVLPENLPHLATVANMPDVNTTGPLPLSLASAPASPSWMSSTPGVVSVPVPFGQAHWGQAMSQQVVWAVNQNLSSAELHLSPPDLGPVSVRINMDADQSQASISFAAGHGAVREAIEAALPRLRDMLSTQGIALADVNVSSHENFHNARREPAAGRQAGGAAMREHDNEAAMTGTSVSTRAIGMLDTYA